MRTDLPIAQQIIQSAHAAHEAGKQDSSDKIRSLVLCQVSSEEELLHQAERLKLLGIEYILFREPDIDNAVTALATVPLTGRQRKQLSSSQLWRA